MMTTIYTKKPLKQLGIMSRSFFNRTTRLVGKIGFYGGLVPYTGYALYIGLKSNAEITRRQTVYSGKHKQDDTGKPVENREEEDTAIAKYMPLQILGRYENPFEEYRMQTIYEFFLNRVLELFEKNRGGIPKTSARMDELMPVHEPEWVKEASLKSDKIVNFKVMSRKEMREATTTTSNNNTAVKGEKGKNLDVTWLGQSCTYVVYQNTFKMLLDPLFSDFLLNEKFGPRRITKLPSQIENVPTPDIILVSHNHPDHLDEKSLEWFKSEITANEIGEKNMNGKVITTQQPLWVIPKGMGKYLESFQVHNYTELSWWETLALETEQGAKYYIHCTPAMHWSGRKILDTNESLWCSYLVQDAQQSRRNFLFHGGDTGYVSDLFKIIKQQYGSCKLGVLPCGQYCPEWHQKPRHINSSEVLKIMKDLECEKILGVHWGTFLLSGEYFREPKEKLETLAEWEGLDKDDCFCPELGKTLRYIVDY